MWPETCYFSAIFVQNTIPFSSQPAQPQYYFLQILLTVVLPNF
jgi:hypothetical protein